MKSGRLCNAPIREIANVERTFWYVSPEPVVLEKIGAIIHLLDIPSHFITLYPALDTSLTKLSMFVPQTRLFWLLVRLVNGNLFSSEKKA